MKALPLFSLVAPVLLFTFLPVADAAAVEGESVVAGETSSSPGENPPTQQENSPSVANRTLSEHVSLLEKKHGVTIFLDQSISPGQGIHAFLENLSLEQSLRTLFADYDYFLFYGTDSEKVFNRIKMVWVFPRSRGAEMRIVPVESTQQACKPSGPDPSNVPRQEDGSVSPHEQMRALNEALSSGDENSWNEALQSAIQAGLPVTPQQLEDCFRNATSDHVRAEILSTVKLMPNLEPSEVQRLSDMAAQGSSPVVRDLALELQKSLSPQEQPQTPDPPFQPTDTPPSQ
jgi:hypothetical protein